jgi:L-ascorbate metabolism protein UlaG (beta-lactamase superfamily)
MKRWSRWGRRVLGWASVALLVLALVGLVVAWRPMGTSASGERLARMERSPQWRDGQFVNPEPLVNDWVDMLSSMSEVSDHIAPLEPLTVTRVDPKRFATPPESGLRVTWFGHASTLIEIDGARVLTDPVWSERVSPVPMIGPARWYPPQIALGQLPKLDAVVISHDHYDHLDYGTIVAMKDWPIKFIAPLGVGAHLEYWGVPASKIVELDWWDEVRVGAIKIVCTPARHASGRHVFDKDEKLWAGYALIGGTHRAYYSGDTGLFRAMREIGDRLGPFDVTMIESGQYHRSWPDWHVGPEQAVAAHRMVRGEVMLPVHWALLTLAYHGWTEPVERVLAEAKREGAQVIAPPPGVSVEPSRAAEPGKPWWPALPWQTALEHPIRSGNVL